MIRPKHMLLWIGAGLIYYSGLLKVWFLVRRWTLGNREICVLGLHRVLSQQEAQRAYSLPGIVLREQTFAGMLEFLRRNYAIVTLGEFLDGGGITASKPRCLLTFDDGWRDNFTTAFPLLKKFQIPAIIFVITDLVEKHETFWVERLGRLWEDSTRQTQILQALEGFSQGRAKGTSFESAVEFLKHLPAQQRTTFLEPWFSTPGKGDESGDELFTWEEASLLEKCGVAIEAHTATHPLLVFEKEATVNQELGKCKRMIEDKLKKKVRAFAYPNGSWNDRVRRQVQESGYDCAFITARGLYRSGEDAFTIRRIMLHEGRVTSPRGRFSPAITALRLTGWI